MGVKTSTVQVLTSSLHNVEAQTNHYPVQCFSYVCVEIRQILRPKPSPSTR